MILHICGILKGYINDLIHKTEETDSLRKQTYSYQMGNWGQSGG